MATYPRHALAPISEALAAWEDWGYQTSTDRLPPVLGEIIGEGSANTVYGLKEAPECVLRVRHRSPSGDVNTSQQELSLWRELANLDLAPPVIWSTAHADVVVTLKLGFDDVAEGAHSELLRRIHASRPKALRLSLEETANRYSQRIASRGLSHLALDYQHEPVMTDLRRLDAEPPCFCHNDLTPSNIGTLAQRLWAIDWEYAAYGSRHFDIAVASQAMEIRERETFAAITADSYFDPDTWEAACRIALLMTHLWALATIGDREDEKAGLADDFVADQIASPGEPLSDYSIDEAIGAAKKGMLPYQAIDKSAIDKKAIDKRAIDKGAIEKSAQKRSGEQPLEARPAATTRTRTETTTGNSGASDVGGVLTKAELKPLWPW